MIIKPTKFFLNIFLLVGSKYEGTSKFSFLGIPEADENERSGEEERKLKVSVNNAMVR